MLALLLLPRKNNYDVTEHDVQLDRLIAAVETACREEGCV